MVLDTLMYLSLGLPVTLYYGDLYKYGHMPRYILFWRTLFNVKALTKQCYWVEWLFGRLIIYSLNKSYSPFRQSEAYISKTKIRTSNKTTFRTNNTCTWAYDDCRWNQWLVFNPVHPMTRSSPYLGGLSRIHDSIFSTPQITVHVFHSDISTDALTN